MDAPSNLSKQTVALAVAAHPDDIEFMMAGTLLLLKEAGAEIHMWNLSNGYCGSDTLSSEEIRRIRWQEAQDSADAAGAVIHPPITEDIAILYDTSLITQAAAVIRKIKPNIVLLPSPEDYMEDHMTACRLVVTAAFVRGMKNFVTSPQAESWNGSTALYHAMPHGLRDSLRRLVRPGQYVDITSVLDRKRAMLAMHRSQKEWLDITQGIDAYLLLMESFAADVGNMSGCFEFAEGWRRHAHWGFGPPGYDPLSDLLGASCWTDPQYEQEPG